MVSFVIRRLFGMAIVLIAVSFIVYVIFFKIPGGDPAQRLAGRTATQGNITAIRHKLALDKPFYVQWGRMMQQLATGKLISYTDQLSVRSQIWQGIPVTFSLAIGAAIIWLFFGILVGVISAVTAGGVSDRGITVLALIGVSMPRSDTSRSRATPCNGSTTCCFPGSPLPSFSSGSTAAFSARTSSIRSTTTTFAPLAPKVSGLAA
jgi:ABC-type dipeptide/oligopeptide/nickel transport system permease component